MQQKKETTQKILYTFLITMARDDTKMYRLITLHLFVCTAVTKAVLQHILKFKL